MATKRLLFGFVIILLGLFILLGNFGLIEWNKIFLQIIFLVIGIALGYSGIKQNKAMTSGIGSAVTGMALVNLLYLIGISKTGWDRLWPFILLFIGFSWIWIYLKSNKGHLLFWGTVMFFLGLLFLLSTFSVLTYSPSMLIQKGWPIIIIALGIWFLSKK